MIEDQHPAPGADRARPRSPPCDLSGAPASITPPPKLPSTATIHQTYSAAVCAQKRTRVGAGVHRRQQQPSDSGGEAVHLRWVRGSDAALSLDSFEVVPLPECGEGVPWADQAEPSAELSMAAVALLANLTDIPQQLVVTATVPLPLCCHEREYLMPISASLAQRQEDHDCERRSGSSWDEQEVPPGSQLPRGASNLPWT